MKKNKQLQKTIAGLVKASFKDSKLVESIVTKSIKVLKSLPKQEGLFALSEYLKGIKRTEREHTLVIESATPLTLTQVSKVQKIVGKRAKITKVKVYINQEILGGFRFTLGDNIWDGSVLGNINQVKEAIAHGGSGE